LETVGDRLGHGAVETTKISTGLTKLAQAMVLPYTYMPRVSDLAQTGTGDGGGD